MSLGSAMLKAASGSVIANLCGIKSSCKTLADDREERDDIIKKKRIIDAPS